MNLRIFSKWLFAALLLLAAEAGRVAVAQQPLDESQAAAQIIEQSNKFRVSQELPRVGGSRVLSETARDFVNFMARTDKFSHTADDKHPRQRAEDHGYQACIVAENIGSQLSTKGFTPEELARRLVEGWKASETHRGNLLDPDVTETGVAIAHSPTSGRCYAVQLFGRPKSQAIVFQIENRAGVAVEYEIDERKLSLEPGTTRTHARCRATDVRFLLPSAADEEHTVTEHVAAATHFVIEMGRSNELVISRKPG